MQVLKEEIRKRIYNSAIGIFTQKGYLKATIKDIADDANVPVGLIYSYYENKEALLDEIVGGIYNGIHSAFDCMEKSETEGGNEKGNIFLNIVIPKVLELINNHHCELVILIDKCNGTKYDDAKSIFIDLSTNRLKDTFARTRPDIAMLVDDLFYHILATGFCDAIFELARHYKGEEWVKNMLYLIARHRVYGTMGM